MRVYRRLALIGAAVVLMVALLGLAVGLVVLSDDARTQWVTGGGTQVVRITMDDVDVDPGRLVVAPGTHLLLDVVNEDSVAHDLVVKDGSRTPMLNPGESQQLDLGTVTGDFDAWCTVPGHKLAGMTLDIRIDVESPPAAQRSR